MTPLQRKVYGLSAGAATWTFGLLAVAGAAPLYAMGWAVAMGLVVLVALS